MAYDGLVAGAMAIYLNGLLSGGRIEKIYQPEPGPLTFHMTTGTGKVFLLLSANSSHPRIHLIENQPANLSVHSSFCMFLLKHLTGSRIIAVKKVGRARTNQLA